MRPPGAAASSHIPVCCFVLCVVGSALTGGRKNRLLGSVAEAEDAVQEAYTRWYALPERRRGEVSSPTGWLVKDGERDLLRIVISVAVARGRIARIWATHNPAKLTGWA